MALNTCPECGKEISSEDKTCPNCGCPIEQPKEKKENKRSFEDILNEGEKKESSAISSNLKYSKKSLLEGEQIIAAAKWSPFLILISVLLLIVSIIFLGAGASVLSSYWEEDALAWGVYFPLSVICFVFFIIFLLGLTYNEFVITNKRIIVKAGFIIRRAFELKIEMLESVNVYQGILGRIFKFGTIGICGIGASRCWVNFIADPLEFRNKFYEVYYKVKSVDSAKVNQNM